MYVEYALKKSRLLSTVSPQISESVQNDLVVAGLPPFVRSRLNRDVLTSRNRLMAELTKIDSSNKFKAGIYTKTFTNTNPKGSIKTYSKPRVLFVPRVANRTDFTMKKIVFRERTYDTNKNTKMVNKAELETELNTTVKQQNK